MMYRLFRAYSEPSIIFLQLSVPRAAFGQCGTLVTVLGWLKHSLYNVILVGV